MKKVALVVVAAIAAVFVLLLILGSLSGPDKSTDAFVYLHLGCKHATQQYVKYPSSFETKDGDIGEAKRGYDAAGGAVITVDFTVHNAYRLKVSGESVCSIKNGRMMEDGSHN